MTDDLSASPAYTPIPGTLQLPSEAATVVTTGGGGGGCGEIDQEFGVRPDRHGRNLRQPH
jgi:hypothetical protein